jgi:hypothetical protein
MHHLETIMDSVNEMHVKTRKYVPSKQAYRTDIAFEPTEVPHEFAESFAPIPNAITIAIIDAVAISHVSPSGVV